MNVLVAVPDLFALAGNIHVSLKLADIIKELGNKVVILYSDIREVNEQYFSLPQIGEYYPLKNLQASDFEKVSWENYYVEVLARLGLYGDPQYQLFLTNFDSYAYINEDVDSPQIFYVNWPDRPIGPTGQVWANSKYTQEAIWKRWGVQSKVVNPPIHLEKYDSSKPFKQRDIAVVGYGQLYLRKGFKVFSSLRARGLKTCVIGADVKQDKPDVTYLAANSTFNQVTNFLSRSKIFVHAKIGEHFGIAIIEAMASGCATICHRSGGPLTDIILPEEKYGLLFSTEEELGKKVEYLLSDEDIWKEYSRKAIEGAKRFSYDNVKQEVNGWLKADFNQNAPTR